MPWLAFFFRRSLRFLALLPIGITSVSRVCGPSDLLERAIPGRAGRSGARSRPLGGRGPDQSARRRIGGFPHVLQLAVKPFRNRSGTSGNSRDRAATLSATLSATPSETLSDRRRELRSAGPRGRSSAGCRPPVRATDLPSDQAIPSQFPVGSAPVAGRPLTILRDAPYWIWGWFWQLSNLGPGFSTESHSTLCGNVRVGAFRDISAREYAQRTRIAPLSPVQYLRLAGHASYVTCPI